MIVDNRSDYSLTIIATNKKIFVGRGEKKHLDLIEGENRISIYINRKSNIHFKLFPLFKASHFLEDHLELNLIFNLSLVVNEKCDVLNIINCSCRCDAPVNLISIALDDYSSVEKVDYYSKSYKKLKKKYVFFEVFFIFLLPLWIFGIALGVVFNDIKLILLACVCLILSLIESYRLIKSIDKLTENQMIKQLMKKAELIKLAKLKGSKSYDILHKFLEQ